MWLAEDESTDWSSCKEHDSRTRLWVKQACIHISSGVTLGEAIQPLFLKILICKTEIRLLKYIQFLCVLDELMCTELLFKLSSDVQNWEYTHEDQCRQANAEMWVGWQVQVSGWNCVESLPMQITQHRSSCDSCDNRGSQPALEASG